MPGYKCIANWKRQNETYETSIIYGTWQWSLGLALPSTELALLLNKLESAEGRLPGHAIRFYQLVFPPSLPGILVEHCAVQVTDTRAGK